MSKHKRVHLEITETVKGYLTVEGKHLNKINGVLSWHSGTLVKLDESNIYLIVGKKVGGSDKNSLDLIRIYATNINGEVYIHSILPKFLLNVKLDFIPDEVDWSERWDSLKAVASSLRPLLMEYVIDRNINIEMFRSVRTSSYEYFYTRRIMSIRENKSIVGIRRFIVSEFISRYGAVKFTPKLITGQINFDTWMVKSLDIKRLNNTYYLSVEFTNGFISKHRYCGDTLFKMDLDEYRLVDGITLINQNTNDKIVALVEDVVNSICLKYV